jgi:DNA-binding CsgD family transcriptional regulator
VSEGQVWARRGVLARMEHRSASSAAGRGGESMLDQHLSDREREVCRQAAMGLSNREMAKRLAISQATVKAHLTRIFQKLGVRGRTELAAAYHGMLPLAPRAPSPLGPDVPPQRFPYAQSSTRSRKTRAK